MISPGNPRLGLTALTRRLGLVERPDNPDRELITYKVVLFFFFLRILSFIVGIPFA